MPHDNDPAQAARIHLPGACWCGGTHSLCPDPADHRKAGEYDALMDDVKAEAKRTGKVVAIPVHISEALALAAAVRRLVETGLYIDLRNFGFWTLELHDDNGVRSSHDGPTIESVVAAALEDKP